MLDCGPHLHRKWEDVEAKVADTRHTPTLRSFGIFERVELACVPQLKFPGTFDR